MKQVLTLAVFWGEFLALCSVQGFSPMPVANKSSVSTTMTTALFGKKLSMAERRRQRAKRRLEGAGGVAAALATLPKPKGKPILSDNSKEEEDENQKSANDNKIYAATPREAANKAKELLKAQRDSVNMLTLVRQRVEEKLATVTDELVQNGGYYYVDDFLGDTETIQQIQMEGETLYERGEMQIDVKNIGSGEYTCKIQGGQEQYAICPRSIELVVSTTKHFPNTSNNMLLDTSNGMSEMRTFDRNAYQASLDLLLAKNDASEESSSAPSKEGERPFRKVKENAEDRRKISLCYYVVPEGWDHLNCGGDLTFQIPSSSSDNNNNDNTNQVYPVTVHAKRDRLVVWDSDISYRREQFLGHKQMPSTKASCVELHLIEN